MGDVDLRLLGPARILDVYYCWRSSRRPRSAPVGPRVGPLGGRARQGRASYTMLNGVSAARRNRVKPALWARCRTGSSPACAPSE